MTRVSIARAPAAAHGGPLSKGARQLLLGCGVLYSLAYVAAGAFASSRYLDCEVVGRGMGQGASSWSVCTPLGVAEGGLQAAFGLGVWACAARGSGLRIAAGLLVALGVLGTMCPLAHWSEYVPGTSVDGVSVAFACIEVPTILVAVGSGSSGGSRWFFAVSVATLLVVAAFGIATSLEGLRATALLPTPHLALYERVEVGAYVGWIVALAVVLLGRELRRGP